jgi:3-hydroxyisobutyrate dehydrogenase
MRTSSNDVARCFESYADPIVHLGGLGSGQTTKLLNNVLFTANLGTAASTLALGEALGVLPDRLTEVIARGSANSFALNVLGGDAGGLDRLAGMAGALLQKDVHLLADLTGAAKISGGAVLDAADATLSLMAHPR